MEEDLGARALQVKRICDGAATLTEAIELGRAFVQTLESLLDEGWELSKQGEDGQIHIHRLPR